MFSSAEIRTRLRNRKMIPPPTRPLTTANNRPKPTHIDEKQVSRYPVPPNQAKTAASEGGLKGEPPLRAACVALVGCDAATGACPPARGACAAAPVGSAR